MFGDHGKVQQQNTSEVQTVNSFLPYIFTFKVMDGNKLKTNQSKDGMLLYVALTITPACNTALHCNAN